MGNIKKIKCDDGYSFPITVSEAVYVSSKHSLSEVLNGIKTMTGHMPSTYMVDLVRWDLNNNPTDFNDAELSKLTSIRLNRAIEWAKEQGYIGVVLPKGTYLIDEYNPIHIPSYMTFNLGGSTLRIRNNGIESYSVILIDNDKAYIHITNGEIVGDKDFHDYVTVDGSHEWGMGISVEGNVNFVLIDNMNIHSCIGDTIYTEARPNFRFSISNKWESGAIDLEDGTVKSDDNKIRLISKFSLDDVDIKRYERFGIYGNGWGNLGHDIDTETFDIIFYDASDKFVSSYSKMRVFDDIALPEDAEYANIVLYQSNLPSGEKNTVLLSVGVGLLPRNIYIENNHLHHSRRCGLAPTGRHIYIRGNDIHDIKGGSPGSVIDVEDGYKLNQFIHIEENNLHDCRIGVSFVSTQNVFFARNNMDRLGGSTVWGDCKSVVIDSNIVHRCTWDLQGDAIFTNNNLVNAGVSSRKKSQHIIANNYLYNSTLSVSKDVAYSTLIDGNRLYNDRENGGGSSVGFYSGQPQTIQNCEFIGELSMGASDTMGWRFNNNHFLDNGSMNFSSGVYKGCTFDNATIAFRTQSTGYTYEFIDCEFRNFKNGQQVFASYDQPMYLLRFKGCRIYGNNNPFIYFRDMNGRLEIIDNIFDYETDGSTLTIIQFLTDRFVSSDKLIVEGNRFTANSENVSAMSSLKENITPIIRFRNNTLDSVSQIIDNENVIDTGNLYG